MSKEQSVCSKRLEIADISRTISTLLGENLDPKVVNKLALKFFMDASWYSVARLEAIRQEHEVHVAFDLDHFTARFQLVKYTGDSGDVLEETLRNFSKNIGHFRQNRVKVNLQEIANRKAKKMHKHIYISPKNCSRIIIPAWNSLKEPLNVALEVSKEHESTLKTIVIAAVQEVAWKLQNKDLLYNHCKIVTTKQGYNKTASGSQVSEFEVSGGPLLPFLTLLVVSRDMSKKPELSNCFPKVLLEVYNEKQYDMSSETTLLHKIPEDLQGYFSSMLANFEKDYPSAARFVIQKFLDKFLDMGLIKDLHLTSAPAVTYMVRDSPQNTYFGFTPPLPIDVRDLPTSQVFEEQIKKILTFPIPADKVNYKSYTKRDNENNSSDNNDDDDNDDDDDDDDDDYGDDACEGHVSGGHVLEEWRNEYALFNGIFPYGASREMNCPGDAKTKGYQFYIPGIKHAYGQGDSQKKHSQNAFNLSISTFGDKTHLERVVSDSKNFFNSMLTNLEGFEINGISNRIEIKCAPQHNKMSINALMIGTFASTTSCLKEQLIGYKASDFITLAKFYAMALEVSQYFFRILKCIT